MLPKSENYGYSPKFNPFSVDHQVASLKFSKNVLASLMYT